MHFDRLSVALFAQCHPNPQTRIPASLWQSIGDGQIKLEIFAEINSIPGTIFAGYFTIHSNALFAPSPPNLHNISNTNHYPLFWHAFRKAFHTYIPSFLARISQSNHPAFLACTSTGSVYQFSQTFHTLLNAFFAKYRASLLKVSPLSFNL